MKFTITSEYVDYIIPNECHKPRYVQSAFDYTVNIKETTRAYVTPVFIIKTFQDEDREMIKFRGSLYIQVQDQIPETRKHIFVNMSTDKYGLIWLKYHIRASTDSYKDMTASMDRRAAELLIVDDKIYIRTGEPYYHPITFGPGGNHGSTTYNIQFAENWKKKIYGLSPASLEAAREATIKIALERGDIESVEHIKTCYEEIVVLDSTAIKKTYHFKY